MRLRTGGPALRVLLVVALALPGSGCMALRSDTPTRISASRLIGKRWLVETIDGVSVPVDTESTLSFDSGIAVSGKGGCNAFTASVEILDGVFRAGPLSLQGAPCSPALMALQARYFAALEAVRRFEAGDLYLLLFDAEGRQRLGLSVILPPSQSGRSSLGRGA